MKNAGQHRLLARPQNLRRPRGIDQADIFEQLARVKCEPIDDLACVPPRRRVLRQLFDQWSHEPRSNQCTLPELGDYLCLRLGERKRLNYPAVGRFEILCRNCGTAGWSTSMS